MKSVTRWAGARSMPPPASAAARSSWRCSAMPPSGAGKPSRARSATSTATTRPLLAYGESRRDRLMPLTTMPSGSVAAGTIQPPGHMQNEKTPRPAGRRVREPVRRRRQLAVSGRAAVLDAIDERLRVLDAHAHRERLGLEPHAGAREQVEDIARGVAGRDHDGAAEQLAAIGEADADRAAIAHDDLGHARAEPHLGADRGERLAQRGDHARQLVRADVRARVDEDVVGRAVDGEDLDDVAHVAALVRARVELAVGVGACAALAEAVVGVGIDAAVLGQALQVSAPRLDRLAAVDDHRGDAGARQLVGAEQAGRPAADDDDRVARGGGVEEGRAADRRAARGADDDVEAHAAAARIDRALADLDRRQRRERRAELLRRACRRARPGRRPRRGSSASGVVDLGVEQGQLTSSSSRSSPRPSPSPTTSTLP